MAKLEIHYSGDWAALYVDGVLDAGTVGDSYHAEERALELCGVTRVHTTDFLRGGKQREDAAPTLNDLVEWEANRARLLAEAKVLRQRAAELEAEAETR
jgi:hypothetical protein